MNNNNSVESSSTSTLSDEQISKLLSLIKYNLLNDNRKGVQANMAVPKYCVTLVSVHKVARDNKFIVGFDESKCFFMSQDLMDVKIMETGREATVSVIVPGINASHVTTEIHESSDHDAITGPELKPVHAETYRFSYVRGLRTITTDLRSPGNCSGKYHTKDLGGSTTTKKATDGVESALQ
ncbi:hypothetical protein Tco_0211068 [Tanacetum coccineum]